MAELEDKLNAILGNPQAMGQILSMAKALSGGSDPAPSSDAAPESQAEPPPPEEEGTSPLPSTPDLGALLGDIAPDLLQKGLSLLQTYRAGDGRREALLDALAPYLSPQRREKLDRVRQIIRLSRTAAAALELFRSSGEEAGHV